MSKLLSKERLDEIRARWEETTKGRWKLDAGGHVNTDAERPVRIFGPNHNNTKYLKDGAFAANAHDDVPDLLDHIAALTDERDKLQARCAGLEALAVCISELSYVGGALVMGNEVSPGKCEIVTSDEFVYVRQDTLAELQTDADTLLAGGDGERVVDAIRYMEIGRKVWEIAQCDATDEQFIRAVRREVFRHCPADTSTDNETLTPKEADNGC